MKGINFKDILGLATLAKSDSVKLEAVKALSKHLNNTTLKFWIELITFTDIPGQTFRQLCLSALFNHPEFTPDLTTCQQININLRSPSTHKLFMEKILCDSVVGTDTLMWVRKITADPEIRNSAGVKIVTHINATEADLLALLESDASLEIKINAFKRLKTEKISYLNLVALCSRDTSQCPEEILEMAQKLLSSNYYAKVAIYY